MGEAYLVNPVCSGGRSLNYGNREVEDLHQEGQAVLTKMAEEEHSEPVKPLGDGRARLPYVCYHSYLVEWPLRGDHTMVAVEVPHEPSECPIMLSRTGSKLPVEGLCNRLQAGVGLSLEGNWNIWWGTRPLATQIAQKGPVALGVGGAVGGLQEDPSLVLCFLANEPLDFPVQQFDGRVERVVGAVLISLRDEGCSNP